MRSNTLRSASHVVAAAMSSALVIATLTSSASGQSVTGSTTIDARCGPSQMRNIALNDDFTIAAHGECPAPRFGGLASINDSSARVRALSGLMLGELSSRSDFFGTRDDAGTASALAVFTLSATDVVFSDIANPGRTGDFMASMNYVVGARVATQGHSNCSANHPQAHANFFITIPGGGDSGDLQITGGGGAVASGVLAGQPNDGTPVIMTSPGNGGISLTFPYRMDFQVSVSTGITYCDSPPAQLGTADAMLLLHLPCGTPVFNLPPGITVNSAQLGIVNNIWRGPTCCPADFNHDGSLNSADFFDFLTAFFTAAPSADFNRDGAVNSQDFFDYVGSFFAGC